MQLGELSVIIWYFFLFRRHNSLNSYCICYGASTSFIQNAFRYLLPGIHTYSIFLPRLTTKSFVSEQACKHLFTSKYYHLSTIFCTVETFFGIVIPIVKCCSSPSRPINRIIFFLKPPQVNGYWQNRILIFKLKISKNFLIIII